MSLELIDIALAERHDHPHLENRVTGKVRAVLTETIDGHEQRHELLISSILEHAARHCESEHEPDHPSRMLG